jgi:hypothetical protein
MTRRINQASARQTQPWREHGIARATWFRRRARAGKAGKTAEPETGMLRQRETDAHETIKPPETGPCAGAETGPPLRLIESPRGPGRCAQCSDLRDGTETEFIIKQCPRPAAPRMRAVLRQIARPVSRPPLESAMIPGPRGLRVARSSRLPKKDIRPQKRHFHLVVSRSASRTSALPVNCGLPVA